MNPGNAHRILGALVELGFMERDADRYVVIEPGSLLEAWCEQARISRGDLWLPVLGAVMQEVYLDLLALPERAQEAAEHLRDEVLGLSRNG